MKSKPDETPLVDWKEIARFKPVFVFIGTFLFLYVIGNLAYGWMIESYRPAADPFTREVTRELASCLSWFGFDAVTWETADHHDIRVFWNNRNVIAVYEGCNGLNVLIVWWSFLLAIGPRVGRMWWFGLGGSIAIHALNLLRLLLLFAVAVYWPRQFYFVHKYLFTAFIYFFVFAGWLWWLHLNRTSDAAEPSSED